MSEKIHLSENVLLIDVAFLNFVMSDLKRYFEPLLKRQLPDVDFSELSTYLALDAGITEGTNEIQTLLVYDDESAALENCSPSNLKEELNGVAFTNQFGEFSFASVPCADMVSREDLYLDLLHIVLDSADVKKLILISFNEEYGAKVTEALKDVQGKEIVQFRMNEPEEVVNYQWEMLAYPVMQAFGIKAEEL
ncbi:DUF6621 family protein [Bacteroides sp.]|uniref:DUF6621 family protein n=2 Tax=Bacteroides sp. TaxID=29523 RepID=UPI001B79AC7E|nr:DUF6621 family protein [Bacteroides sp.]MBP8622600.1 hypothetical protein [Bacteroides sp.]MBP9507240.1 hypothetical protein [Bacteroides sp.]